jgi:Surfeit locus protein 2 (SURF2)
MLANAGIDVALAVHCQHCKHCHTTVEQGEVTRRSNFCALRSEAMGRVKKPKDGKAKPKKEPSSATNGSAAEEVKALLAANDFLSLNEHGKVHCGLTGLDVPARPDAVHAHLRSPKLKKQKEWYNFDFTKYEPHITANRKVSAACICSISKHFQYSSHQAQCIGLLTGCLLAYYDCRIPSCCSAT